MADAEALRPIGIHAERVANTSDFREKAFVEHWQQKETDTLDMLLRKSCDRSDARAVGTYYETNGYYRRPLGPVIERDRIIVETVIQWLGSNCGMGFLTSVLRSIGGDIKWPPRPGTEMPATACASPSAIDAERLPDGMYHLLNSVLYMLCGVCPSCGHLQKGAAISRSYSPSYVCEKCAFTITREEADAVLQDTVPAGKKCVAAFETWKSRRDCGMAATTIAKPADITDRDKVIALFRELGVAARVHSRVHGNSETVAVTCPSRQGQPGVVFEFNRGDHSFVGVFGESE